MEVTEQNIIDIELSINNLIQQKEKLIFDKKEIELKNSVINNQIRSGGRMHEVKYKRLCDQQTKLKKDSFAVEKSISDLSIEIMKKSTLREQIKSELKNKKKIDVKEKLTEMRDYYINFAADKTRVSSIRAAAAEFAEKLEGLIKSI